MPPRTDVLVGPSARAETLEGVGSRLLRVLHVVSSLLVGGMEQFVVRLAAEQSGRGHAVKIIGLRGGPLLERAQQSGVPARAIEQDNKILRTLSFISQARAFRPDVINAHNPVALRYAMLPFLGSRVRIVMTRHGQEEVLELPSPRTLSKVGAVIAVSEAAARAFRRHRPGSADKVVMIRNGAEAAVPTKSRKTIRDEIGIDGSAFVGTIVARVDHLKGHDTLLRAAAELRALPLEIVVVGDGARRNEFERLAEELNIARRVRFLGYRTDIADLLAASDFFVLPSLTEGTPLSVLEAMMQGLPIVASDVGGLPELVVNGSEGILLPPGDPQGVASAIDTLWRDEPLRLRMGAAALARATRDFTLSQMARNYDAVYRGQTSAV